MALMGVMWRETMGPDGKHEGVLNLAWGDKVGEFLGWETVANMAVVRAMQENMPREIYGFGNWNAMEAELRNTSWGKEL
jgi:hypothetical protein